MERNGRRPERPQAARCKWTTALRRVLVFLSRAPSAEWLSSAAGRRRRALADLGLLVARVAVERARRSELSELMPHHVLGDEDRNELPAVVHREREPHRIRDDGGAARPGLDDLLRARRLRGLDLLHQVAVHEGTLLNASRHRLTLGSAPTHNHR